MWVYSASAASSYTQIWLYLPPFHVNPNIESFFSSSVSVPQEAHHPQLWNGSVDLNYCHTLDEKMHPKRNVFIQINSDIYNFPPGMAQSDMGREQKEEACTLPRRNRSDLPSLCAVFAGWINFSHHLHLSVVNGAHATAQPGTLMFINFLQREMR